jgi:hypothetical protein
MKYQVLRPDYQENAWFANWKHLAIKDLASEVQPNLPVIVGGDLRKPHVRQWLNQQQPAIYIMRGYVGNHMYKTRRLWRYSVNGWANIKLEKQPYSRWPIMQLDRHHWKVKTVKNVLIAPSAMTAPIWDPHTGWDWAEHMSKQFPGATVKIRYKIKKSGARWSTLFQDLDWADLVVAQGSAITAEAFWYGKKVISTHPCITWAAGQQSLEDWQNPAEPELREQWHEHLAWSQFFSEEWESGQALDLIQKYMGNAVDVRHNWEYSFKQSL